MTSFFNRFATRPAGALVVVLLRLGVGVVIGVFIHYLFYRVSLPVEPFIYVAF